MASTVAPVRFHPAALMGALGLASGILSITWGFNLEPPWLGPVARLFLLDAGTMPMGVFYGVALGLGIALVTGRLWAAPLVLLTTLIAWSAAIHTATSIFEVAEGGGTKHMRNLLAGVAGGAVGAALTHVGAALVSNSLRVPRSFLLTTVVGAVLGVLFLLGEINVVPSRTLYIVWQPAVAICIGLALAGAAFLTVRGSTSAPARS